MEMIDSINVEKFNDAMVVIGKGPCVKFDCDRQSICAEEKVECKAFRYWVNNDSYWTKRKGLPFPNESTTNNSYIKIFH